VSDRLEVGRRIRKPARENARPFRYFPFGAGEAGIVLQWLTRLRWLAVAGQSIATFVAAVILKLNLPWAIIGAIIGTTALSNIVLGLWRRRWPAPWLVPSILVLDVWLLTALLICSGGPANPFSALYLVHVAMAVVTLTESWSWFVVAVATGCYALLFFFRPMLTPLGLSPLASAVADWVALTLVAIVIAYFVGRLMHSLRRHQMELARARERASRNEQLASLTTLAAGAAHELNTPLSTIAVVARELEVQSAKLALAESFSQDARLIRQEVDRCQYILDRMRADVTASPAVQSEQTSEDFVAELRKDLQPIAGQSLRIDCSTELGPVTIGTRAVRQAVSILVDNAVDASPEGESVDLCIFSRNGHIVFEVKDRGSGMPAEVARRAGEPFFTTKPPGEGMGLGLFLARLVAEKLGGSLTLQSEPGQGTRATLELPRI
jgi:two-component system, sensor histidine kinase RegB